MYLADALEAATTAGSPLADITLTPAADAGRVRVAARQSRCSRPPGSGPASDRAGSSATSDHTSTRCTLSGKTPPGQGRSQPLKGAPILARVRGPGPPSAGARCLRRAPVPMVLADRRDRTLHELAIAESVVTTVLERTGDAPVRVVRLRVGRLAGVVPDALSFCFDLGTRGTRREGASLEIAQEPGRAPCRECAADFTLEDPFLLCACGSADVQVLTGR